VIASLIFSAAQFCAIRIEDPNYLKFVSGLTGLAYGFLFGVYPSLVAEAFGVHGLSQNWGCMTLAPVVSGNIFNLFYGLVYDSHSEILPGGERQCDEGLSCYRSAYMVTIGACVLGLAVSLWSIQHAHSKKVKELKANNVEDHVA
jgi:MFS family permease